ncbi:MAG: hypothetical protein IKC65_10150 [Lentisphaeria bacterium]|nr:hypothetical protein [Lentisphaeria bacterium]
MTTKEHSVSGLEFRRIGGALQIVIENFEQLKQILALDEAWFAITGIDCNSLRTDQKFLAFLDSDKNGKIRTDELKDAVRFLLDVLKDGSAFDARSTELPLEAINTDSVTGAEILASAKLVLSNLGKPEADIISLDDINNEKQIKSCVLCNGDGIVDAASAEGAAARAIELAVRHGGSETDLSGAAGINAKRLDDFAAAAASVLAWYKEADDTPALLPFGDRTKAVLDAYLPVKEAFNDFFLSSATLAFLDTDPDRLAKKDSIADVKSPAEVMELLKKLAVASPSPDGQLPLAGAINPLWKDKVALFAGLPETAAFAADGKLSHEAWLAFSAQIAPAEDWFKRRPDFPALLAVSREELEEAASEPVLTAIRDLIARDLEAGAALARIETLHKLLLYQRYLLDFLKNFLNLSDLFDPHCTSWLQTGTLVMDGRHFSLAVPVTNPAEHKKIAATSNICTAYVEISRGEPAALKKQLLAVAITSGNMRHLFPGKRGIFFDTEGAVHDARITDFIRQPVSVGEALKNPFYRLGAFIGKQADKLMTTKSNAAQQELSKTIAAGKLPPVPAAKQPQSANGSMLLMGGGIGLAAIGSSIAFIVKSLQNISILNIITVLCGILLVFGGPVVIVSLIKLYKRDLGRFLEASGCALNFPMRLSRRLGNFFTMAPKRPVASWIGKEKLLAEAEAFQRKRLSLVFLIVLVLILLTVGVTLHLLNHGLLPR